MTVVMNDIIAAVCKEQEAAEHAHGLHHSDAEKYAVILEELEEAEEALRDARKMLSDMWSCVRTDNHEGARLKADSVAGAAIAAAIECVQLAAVAQKEVM